MTAKKPTIKQNLAKLEEIITWFNQDQFEIEQSIDKYQAALKLVAEVKQQLAETENQIKQINNAD